MKQETCAECGQPLNGFYTSLPPYTVAYCMACAFPDEEERDDWDKYDDWAEAKLQRWERDREEA